MKGIEAAAAAGIVGGNASRELEVISEVSGGQKQAMRDFLAAVPISVNAIDNGILFDIHITLYRGRESAVVRICQYHTNIVYIQKNDTVLLDNTGDPTLAPCGSSAPAESGLTDRSLLNIADIYAFADTCDLADVRRCWTPRSCTTPRSPKKGCWGITGQMLAPPISNFTAPTSATVPLPRQPQAPMPG